MGAKQALADDNGYTVHPPALTVPSGKPGEIRRSIMQFKYWTLICDENIDQKKMVCNVTQSIHDKDGKVVFSWSLGATKEGTPFLLFRTLPDTDKKQPIRLAFDGLDKVIGVDVVDCNQDVCLGQTIVGSLLLPQIKKAAVAHIGYRLKNGDKIRFDAPMEGLSDAVSSIK